jgi:hypothetical protein
MRRNPRQIARNGSVYKVQVPPQCSRCVHLVTQKNGEIESERERKREKEGEGDRKREREGRRKMTHRA